jgi:hypothetical protein
MIFSGDNDLQITKRTLQTNVYKEHVFTFYRKPVIPMLDILNHRAQSQIATYV